MLWNLDKITTKYTLMLMDDFFLRKCVDIKGIEEVLVWHEEDERAAVFSFQNINDSLNTESDKYIGYNKRPRYGEYKYNFQAAIWKTKVLREAWRSFESPWEWETLGNYRSFSDKYDFYVLGNEKETPIDYGFNRSGMGVFRGKWVEDSVVELFEKNHIQVDYTRRGFYEKKDFDRWEQKGGFAYEIKALKSFNFSLYIKILLWRLVRVVRKAMGKEILNSYIDFKRKKK